MFGVSPANGSSTLFNICPNGIKSCKFFTLLKSTKNYLNNPTDLVYSAEDTVVPKKEQNGL